MGRGRLLAVAVAVVAGAAASLALPTSSFAACGQTSTPRRSCLLPFPNDFAHTKRDRNTPTGRRVDLARSAMPRNAKGQLLDPREWNRNDGFSPGQTILVKIPTLKTQADFNASRIVPNTDLAQYKARNQPLLLLDEKTGRRQLVWGELDANPTVPDSSGLVFIHPARNLVPGRRYVVVLRNLPGAGRSLGVFSSNLPATRSALAKAGVSRASIYLAWNFTVASDKSLTSRLLAIRDNAFRQLGDTNLRDGTAQGRAPAFAITEVKDFTEAENAKLARRVTGTFTVPCYLNQPGCPPGSRFRYANARKDALPVQTAGNVVTAPFQCNIPRRALTSPSHPAVYGHGLLGKLTQIDDDNIQDMSVEHNFTFCATNWQGMSEEDVPNAVEILQDFSKFPELADRLQQGMVNTLYLGRLLAHPQGFAANPAFQTAGGGRLLGSDPVTFDSNSQGAILGGLATAIAPDWRRGVLGVATMNYALLLPRSVDFDTYLLPFRIGYADPGVRRQIVALAQMLWDRGETNGWSHRVTTRPPRNTPTHAVLLHAAVADHQVANLATDVEARSLGIPVYQPAVAPGRMPDRTPLFGIPRIRAFPFRGSALVYWDGGPQTPPSPPTMEPNRAGRDPHSFPRRTRAARQQKADFLLRGVVTNQCGGAPCRTDNFG